MATQSIVSNGTATLISNGFTKTGYSFASWNTLVDGSGTSYSDAATYTIATVDVTLYTQWSADSQTLNFNGNTSDGGSTASQSILSDASATLTSNGFTKTGFTFVSWNTLVDGSGTSYSDVATYTIVTAAATLYAQWSAI